MKWNKGIMNDAEIKLPALNKTGLEAEALKFSIPVYFSFNAVFQKAQNIHWILAIWNFT